MKLTKILLNLRLEFGVINAKQTLERNRNLIKLQQLRTLKAWFLILRTTNPLQFDLTSIMTFKFRNLWSYQKSFTRKPLMAKKENHMSLIFGQTPDILMCALNM